MFVLRHAWPGQWRIFSEGCDTIWWGVHVFAKDFGTMRSSNPRIASWSALCALCWGNLRIVQPIHRLTAQNLDPRFVQGNLQIFWICTLHMTYIQTDVKFRGYVNLPDGKDTVILYQPTCSANCVLASCTHTCWWYGITTLANQFSGYVRYQMGEWLPTLLIQLTCPILWPSSQSTRCSPR